jgi:hypothetical protein
MTFISLFVTCILFHPAKSAFSIFKVPKLTRVNSTNILDAGLRIGEIGRRMNSKVKSVK